MCFWKQYPNLTLDDNFKETHIYRWKEFVADSSTQVLGAVARKIKGKFVPICDSNWCKNEVAANFGNSFHKAIAYIETGIDVEYPDEMKPWIEQYKKWRKGYSDYEIAVDENGVKLIEYPMYSERFKYCGTPDAVFIRKKGPGEILLVDWKTSTAEIPYWKYQIASYENLIIEVFPEFVYRRKLKSMAVQFKEDAVYEHKNTSPADWAIFQSCLNIRSI
jgi:hypothetical protein